MGRGIAFVPQIKPHSVISDKFLYSHRLTLGQLKSDNNNRIIKLTDVFIYCRGIMGPAISDYNKWLILLSMIQLSDEHCI